MIRQPHSAAREAIVAKAIAPVVAELRLVEPADYVAFIRLEQFGCLADIVASAAELFFMPGTVRLGHDGDADLAWNSVPVIRLDLELRPRGVTVWASLTLGATHAGVEVSYVSFAEPDGDPEANSAFLARALNEARIRRTEPVGG